MIWFRPELRVLFVCSANVCRSPLAEGLMRHRLRAMGLARRVQVRSAGSAVGQRGRRPDPRIEELAAQAGISLGRIRSRRLTPEMIRRSDYVLVMDRSHLHDLERLCATTDSAGRVVTDPQDRQKIQLLGSFLPGTDNQVKDIPDPYFGDWQNFGEVYELIDSALTGLLARVEMDLENSRDS